MYENRNIMVQQIIQSEQVAISPPNTKVATQSQRLTVIDMLRGFAMLVMALEHSAYFTRTNYVAESYGRAQPDVQSLAHILIGFITNTASGIFFTLMGTSVAFFENSRRKKGWSEWQITRFFLIRGLILFVLDKFMSRFAWHQATWTVDVLSTIAINLVVLAFIRRLSWRIIAIVAVSLFFVYPLLVDRFPYDATQPFSAVTTILLQYHTDAPPFVEFPVLGRLSLVLMGYVLGRLLIEKKITITSRVFWLVPVFLVAGCGLRLLGGYGNFTPYQVDQPWVYFFIESKQPPSTVFLLFNIAKGLFVLGVIQLFVSRLSGSLAGRILVTLGQTSLFFYCVHLLLFSNIISGFTPATFLPNHAIIRDFLEWSVGMAILIPLCFLYRDLRQKHPGSILQYF
jgi:uncharacterized membrane protein